MSPTLFFMLIVLTAYAFAKLEIQIEGNYGWAEKLPTWRKQIRVPILSKIFRDKPITGYHFYFLLLFMPFLLHTPFIYLAWSLKIELFILSFYIFMLCLEDFLWFMLNPNYGLKKFNKESIKWHQKWFLRVPTEYWMGIPTATLLYLAANSL